MADIKNDYNLREQAFFLQFGGYEDDLKKKIGTFGYTYDCCPVNTILQTGLFGILEAIINLGLTGREISDFYVHRHVDPYNDPYEFTRGIIRIVEGLSKDFLIKEYSDYFSDSRINELYYKRDKNTQMLLCFCYLKDDMYEYISNGEDLYSIFSERYYNLYHNYHNDYAYNYGKEFPKIDGKLFRAIRFLMNNGYELMNLDSLFDEQIEELELKQTNGENLFILDKSYAREMSDSLLGLYYFLQRNGYKTLDGEELFNPTCENIIFTNSSDEQIVFNRSSLEQNINEFIKTFEILNEDRFKVEITSIFDKRVEDIELKFMDFNNNQEYKFIVKRGVFPNIAMSHDFLATIIDYFKQGFTFQDDENLFDTNQEYIKVTDPNLEEQLIKRSLFEEMLKIIISCKKNAFSINYSQLFDMDSNIVLLTDKEGNEEIIERVRIKHIMYTYNLLKTNGYLCNDYNNLFDEKKLYINVYDTQNQERVLSRKQIYKIVKIQQIINENDIYSYSYYSKSLDLSDSEKDLLISLLNDYHFKEKLFQWLPYTAKKWIPSSAVISKIPKEQSRLYFYNNNFKRLGLLKEKFHADTYEKTEGIVSLGYILGLFDSKESVSKKAMEYIIEHFLNKGVTALELHKTYGAIDLSRGFNKNFADFFMRHYALNKEAFVEDELQTDMTGDLFKRFDEVLENRPEKKIKTRTRNKLLTPQDAISFITTFEIDEELLGDKIEDERYINLVQLLMKFGASEEELMWAIKLYEQALAIDEKDVVIPNIVDLKGDLMRFNTILKSDPHPFLSGKKTNCCSRYGGYAQDRLEHAITDINWRYITFTSLNKTFFDGLVWYDKKEQVVCIDNVEGQFSKVDKNNPRSIALMTDTIIRYADGIYEAMNNLKIPCQKVNVGKDDGTASWEIFEYAREQGLIVEDNKPCRYLERNGISTDAHRQFTITSAEVLTLKRKSLW